MSTTTENEKIKSYLTEIILSIHNEVQSALDYISTVVTEEGTDIGKEVGNSTAILSIQNLRVKVPVKFNLETGPEENQETPTNIDNTTIPRTKQMYSEALTVNTPLTLDKTRSAAALVDRSGLVIGQTYSKIGVVLESNDTQTSTPAGSGVEAKKDAWGEIEITFTPLKRQ
jgi:hypothetical protein